MQFGKWSKRTQNRTCGPYFKAKALLTIRAWPFVLYNSSLPGRILCADFCSTMWDTGLSLSTWKPCLLFYFIVKLFLFISLSSKFMHQIPNLPWKSLWWTCQNWVKVSLRSIHTCGDGGSLYKNESELFYFPLSNKAERLSDCHHTSSFLLFFPSLLYYTGVCMQHCPSWVS